METRQDREQGEIEKKLEMDHSYICIAAQSSQDFDAKSMISEQEEFFTPMISETVSETSTLVGSRESLVEVGVGGKKERSFSVVEQEQLEKTLTEIANQQQ